MKKFLFFSFALILILATALLASSCAKEKEIYDGGAIVFVSVKAQAGGFAADASVTDADGKKTEMSVSGDFKFLADVLQKLKSEKGLTLEFDAYGMVAEIGTVKPAAGTNEFICVYLNSEDLAYVDPLWGTVEVNGATYNSTSKGIGEMPVIDGFVFVFKVSVYSF